MYLLLSLSPKATSNVATILDKSDGLIRQGLLFIRHTQVYMYSNHGDLILTSLYFKTTTNSQWHHPYIFDINVPPF